MRYLIALAFVLVGAPLFAQSLDIRAINPDSPISGTIEIVDTEALDERVRLTLAITAPRFFDELDAIARARGNLGSFEHRLFWVGPTRTKSASGSRVMVQTRARYENWIKVKLLGQEIINKNLQDTRSFDVAVTPAWIAEANRLDLTVELLNIHDFPGSLESVLADLVGGFIRTTTVYVADPDDFARLDPVFEPIIAEELPDKRGLRTTLAFTATETGATDLMKEAGFALPNPLKVFDALWTRFK